VDRATLGRASNAAAAGARVWSSLGTLAGNGSASPATAADRERDQGQRADRRHGKEWAVPCQTPHAREPLTCWPSVVWPAVVPVRIMSAGKTAGVLGSGAVCWTSGLHLKPADRWKLLDREAQHAVLDATCWTRGWMRRPVQLIWGRRGSIVSSRQGPTDIGEHSALLPEV
jgi:hypothetical protein